ncbi:MAG: hypothetical protein ABII02_00850 [Candidatus Magasanikbacteria bacterium]
MRNALFNIFVASVFTIACSDPGGSQGTLQQMPKSCDDGISCTADYTAADGSCVHIPQGSCCQDDLDCSDGNPCTEDNCRSDGSCQYVELVCDDGIDCTVDSCIAEADDAVCVFKRDNSLCSTDMVCSEWARGCAECQDYKDCDDGNKCTYDSCNYDTGICENRPNECESTAYGVEYACNPETGGCEPDGVECLTNWYCKDGDPCTDDACNPTTGKCENVYDELCIPCTDENSTAVCPEHITCKGPKTAAQYTGLCNASLGKCEYFTPHCQDGACVIRNCVEGAGCVDEPKCTGCNGCYAETGECLPELANGWACDDEDPCTKNDTCQAGWCAGNEIVCNDGNECTDDTCSPANNGPFSGGGGPANLSCSYENNGTAECIAPKIGFQCQTQDGQSFLGWRYYIFSGGPNTESKGILFSDQTNEKTTIEGAYAGWGFNRVCFTIEVAEPTADDWGMSYYPPQYLGQEHCSCLVNDVDTPDIMTYMESVLTQSVYGYDQPFTYKLEEIPVICCKL